MGTLYMGAGGWVTYALNFVIMIGIARLLGPADFGTYALIAAVNEFLNLVGAGSVGHAVLQARDESRGMNDTAYSISGILGLIGLAFALVCAPVLYVYRGPDAAWFILILGLARIVTFLAGVPIALMERSFRYGRLAGLSTLTAVVPNLVALGLAELRFGPWSLIARDVLVAVSTFAIAHAWAERRLRFRMNRADAQRIMSFWRPTFASRTIDTLAQRVDRLAVGSFFGDAVLGLFHQARLFSEIGPMALRAVNQLAFNLYSRVQDDPARLARACGLVNYFLVRASYAVASVFVVFPEPAIRFLLGDAWTGAAPMLRWLGIYTALAPTLDNLQWLLYARREMRRNVQLRLFQIGVLAPGILAAVHFGTASGVAVAVSASTLAALAAAVWFNRGIVGGTGVRHFVTATVALLVAASVATAFSAAGALEGFPELLLPLLPPVVFAALILVTERATLFRELAYLRAQLAERGAGGAASDLDAPGPA